MSKGDKLTMKWSKREKDMLIHFPCGPDGHLLHSVMNADRCIGYAGGYTSNGTPIIAFEDSFVKELVKRGYDITTLKFSVQRLPKTSDGVSDAE